MISYSNSKLLLETQFAIPRIGEGPKKNQLVLMNNYTYWGKFKKTKIKNTFKEYLREWILNESDLKLKSGLVEFRLHRPTSKRQDADSIAWEGKWFVDALVELGWFEDDNDVTFVYRPVVVLDYIVQPEVHVKVFGYNEDTE